MGLQVKVLGENTTLSVNHKVAEIQTVALVSTLAGNLEYREYPYIQVNHVNCGEGTKENRGPYICAQGGYKTLSCVSGTIDHLSRGHMEVF